MKKKLTSKLMLKIVSVIVAFLFWLVIINITDPTTSKTFYDIPVQILNENVITSANQVYDIVDGDTVKVTVKGKRSFVEKLKESDFTATADLSELSKVNAVSINVKLNRNQLPVLMWIGIMLFLKWPLKSASQRVSKLRWITRVN